MRTSSSARHICQRQPRRLFVACAQYLSCNRVGARAGVRAIAAQEEPIRRVLSRMEVADGLTLEKARCLCN